MTTMRLGWEHSWVEYLEGALYKTAVIIIINEDRSKK